MEFDAVAAVVKGIPHTSPEKGKILYETIKGRGYQRCLELGFACGVGSSYMAAALESQGAGKLTSVDQKSALQRKPRADALVAKAGLAHRVDFVFDETSYTWFLMEALEKGLTFDFCFLDGAHTWEVDGFAFVLVERLLEPGGMIIFDDLDWTIARSPTMKAMPLPERVRQTPGVRKIYELLVKTTPSLKAYEKDGWAYAEKTA